MASSLFMKVEVLAGASAEAAASDLVELSRQLGIMVETTFQDAEMRAWPTDQGWRDVLEKWQRECRLQNYPKS